MEIGAVIGVIGGIIGILGAVVGYTRFAAQAPLQARVTHLEGEVERHRERNEELQATHEDALRREGRRFNELDANYQNLLQDFANLKQGKSGVVIKNEIDAALDRAMRLLQATESSILVPGPAPTSSFVFLSIYGPAAARLRYSKLPLDMGKAGKVYATGRLDNSADPRTDAEFFEGMDEKGAHVTRTLLTLPVIVDGDILGVVQFLNKEGDRAFTPQDERTALELTNDLSRKVAEFVRDSTNFELLGLSAEKIGKEETVVFCDLTASASLFRMMDARDAIDCVKEFIERQSEVAMAHGATVDNYLGDGIMFRFAPRAAGESDQGVRAVRAAQKMLEDFDSLKQSWLKFQHPVEGLYDRFGIATGAVYEAVLGHRQHKLITVIGDTVNTAANLADVSTRSRNVILIDEATRGLLDNGFSVEVVDDDLAQRVKSGGGPFYEVL